MKRWPALVFLLSFAAIAAAGQGRIVISDPAAAPTDAKLSASDRRLIDRFVLPRVRPILQSDACEEEFETAAVMQGSFTRPAAKQTLVFYQFCQTGNGLGSAGVAILENGRLTASFVSAESGWTIGGRRLPDIDRDGLDEFALYYSGGMHQGMGGTGVDIMKYSSGRLTGIGWFQAESFDENSSAAYLVTVRPGKSPAFFRQKFTGTNSGGWRRSGAVSVLRLRPVFGKFTAVK